MSIACWTVPGVMATPTACANCAYLEGAAVAFGLIGMAQAINARRLRRMCDYCHGTGEYLDKGYHGDDPTWEVCGDCNGHGATWARPEVSR